MAEIKASVGYRGVNNKNDVEIVQGLLNKVPHNLGGPLVQLNVDGICGRKTNTAIEKLQAKQRGWNTVTAMIRPGDPIMKLLLSYDLSGFIDNTPKPVVAPEPPPAPLTKTAISSFLITVAAKPGSLMNRENYYFTIENPNDSRNRALYFMGNYPYPTLPVPLDWSITAPPYTNTPIAMGVEDWAGEAVVKETIVGGSRVTKIFLIPTILNRTIPIQIHAHVNLPGGPEGSSVTTNWKFNIVDSSLTHMF